MNLQRGSVVVKILIAVIVVAIIIIGVLAVLVSKQNSQNIVNNNSAPVDTSSQSTLLNNDVPAKTNVENVVSTVPVSPNSVASSLNCNTYDCLISAASKCQPASGVISYSNISNPFAVDFLQSGQTKYEIKKTAGSNNCTLTSSILSSSFNISNQTRQTLLAQGKTQAQIDAQLKTMNDSFQFKMPDGSIKSMFGILSTCISDSNTISSYLADVKNGSNNLNIENKSDFGSDVSTTIYTTSSGQKLTCTSPTVKNF